jgi:hypothetical protein
MCPNPVAIDWATHADKNFATVQVQIKNQTQNNPLNSLPTKTTLYRLNFVHVQYLELVAHEQISWAWRPNKKYQTFIKR